jgi:hypothetical protein
VGLASIITDLIRALWKVKLMLALNHLLLNREYILIKVLKTLVLIVCMSNLHVTFQSKITPKYFELFTNGMSRPFTVR